MFSGVELNSTPNGGTSLPHGHAPFGDLEVPATEVVQSE
jgi:hypothetical protein